MTIGKKLQIAHNAIVAKLIDPSEEVRGIVGELLSYDVAGAEHMTAFKGKSWTGRSSFFSRVTNSFPAGFVFMVQQTLTNKGFEVALIRRAQPLPLGPVSPIVDKFGNDDPRYDFQMKAVRQVEAHHRGIIQVATGGGKSKIAKLITRRYGRTTLFLTTRGALMYQMAAGFEEAGYKVGLIGDGEWSPRSGVNCAMVQTLVARLKDPSIDLETRALLDSAEGRGEKLSRPDARAQAAVIVNRKEKIRAKTIAFLDLIEVVLGEEAQEAGGDSYYDILKHCKNAHVRVALTATPFMKTDAEDNMRLMAAFGPILIKVPEKLLIDRGVLAKPFFKYIAYTPAPKLRRTSPWARAYQLGIVECATRNKAACDFVQKAAEHGLTTIVLVIRKAHGAILARELKARGLKVGYIQGENDNESRQKSLAALQDGRLQVLIGTNILDVGVDVPSVGALVLAGGYKDQVGLRQRTGRALRAKKAGPNVALVVDFEDLGNDTLREHYRTRRAIIESTPGFAENVLPAGKDFDWGMFAAA